MKSEEFELELKQMGDNHPFAIKGNSNSSLFS